MDTGIIAAARGLNHWFGSGEARKQALFDVNLTLPRGSFTVSLHWSRRFEADPGQQWLRQTVRALFAVP